VHYRSCFKAEMFEQCTTGKFAEGEIKQDGGIKKRRVTPRYRGDSSFLVNLFLFSGQLSRQATKTIAS
jgi:hypothetical protein